MTEPLDLEEGWRVLQDCLRCRIEDALGERIPSAGDVYHEAMKRYRSPAAPEEDR